MKANIKKRGKTVEFPLLGFSLSVFKEGTGKGKKIVVCREDKEGVVTLLVDRPYTDNDYMAALDIFREEVKKAEDKEAAKQQESGGALVRRKKSTKPEKKRGTPKTPRPKVIKTPQTEGLIDTLRDYGYDVIPSPKMAEGKGGCYRCIYHGINRANILPASTGVRIGFLFQGAFIISGNENKGKLVIELLAEDENQKNWTYSGKHNGTYKLVNYSGPICPDLLRAFGIDPDGPAPKQVSLQWQMKAKKQAARGKQAVTKSENHDTAVIQFGRKARLNATAKKSTS